MKTIFLTVSDHISPCIFILKILDLSHHRLSIIHTMKPELQSAKPVL